MYFIITPHVTVEPSTFYTKGKFACRILRGFVNNFEVQIPRKTACSSEACRCLANYRLSMVANIEISLSIVDSLHGKNFLVICRFACL